MSLYYFNHTSVVINLNNTFCLNFFLKRNKSLAVTVTWDMTVNMTGNMKTHVIEHMLSLYLLQLYLFNPLNVTFIFNLHDLGISISDSVSHTFVLLYNLLLFVAHYSLTADVKGSMSQIMFQDHKDSLEGDTSNYDSVSTSHHNLLYIKLLKTNLLDWQTSSYPQACCWQ